MKYLLLLLTAFQLEARPAEFAESAIAQVVGLTDAQKNKFCRKGNLLNYSIRSREGELCKNPVAASIAWLACHDQEGFANSNCAKNALALKVIDVKTAHDTLTQVLDFKLSTVSDLCNIIVKVLPDQASKCSEIAASLVGPKTAPKVPVNLAQSIIGGLKIYLDRYNKTTAITSGGGGRSLTVDLAFLPHSKEALYEAKDFFNNSWRQNQAKLEKLSKETKVAGFANQEGFIAVSIGSSSTQCYYMENGQVKTLQYLFGTNPSATKAVLIEKMTQDLKALKRPVVFFNSISFAEPVQNAGPARTTDSISLKNSLFKTTKLNKDGTILDDSAGITANQIAQKLAALNVEDAFIFKPLDGSKFVNKWTNALALESANIPKKGIGLIGDIGGGGMSGKLFLDGKFYDKPNLVLAYLGEGSKGDEYYDQADIVKHYTDGKGGVHKTLIQNMDKLLASVKDFIVSGRLKDASKTPQEVLEWIEKNQNVIKNQKNFYFLIRQTGQLRELYEKMMEELGLALEAFKKGANVLPSFSLFT